MARKRRGAQQSTAPEPTDEKTEEASSEHDLYSVLGVERIASQNDIKKAYHRMALQLHPDKNPGDESAKEKFQMLQQVFSVLGDPEKRRIYDQTGSTEDVEFAGKGFQDLYDYYRTMYTRVTPEDIERFEEEYRGSQEELRDLKELYSRFKGDMKMLFEYMICSEPAVDSHRFKEHLESAIKAGELKSYKPFKQWAADVATRPAPSNPLKPKTTRSKGSQGNADLRAVIQSRQAARSDALFEALASKYGAKDGGKASGGKGSKKRECVEPDISEEEFKKTQERILRSKKAKT